MSISFLGYIFSGFALLAGKYENKQKQPYIPVEDEESSEK